MPIRLGMGSQKIRSGYSILAAQGTSTFSKGSTKLSRNRETLAVAKHYRRTAILKARPDNGVIAILAAKWGD